MLQALGWSKRDAVGSPPAPGTIAILVNALWMQSGPHPAPMFKPRSAVGDKPASTAVTLAAPPAVPGPRPPARSVAITQSPLTPARSRRRRQERLRP